MIPMSNNINEIFVNQSKFLYESISDIRSTIRAIDVKVSFILVILFIPFAKINAINETINSLFQSKTSCFSTFITVFLILVFFACWGIAVLAALRTIISIDNPASHIDGKLQESTFYPAFLFSFSFAPGFLPSHNGIYKRLLV